MKKKIIILISAALLLGAGYFKFDSYKKEKAIRARVADSLDRIHQRAFDSLELIHQRKSDSAVKRLLLAKKDFIDDHKRAVENYTAKKDEKPEVMLLGKGEAKKVKKTLGGSSFLAVGDCEATESAGGDLQTKIELKMSVCKSPKEFTYKIFYPHMGGDPNKVESWYTVLSMDIAALKASSEGRQYFDHAKVLKGVLIGRNNDPASNPDNMKPVTFEGGYLLMTYFKSNGRSSTMEFTIYLTD